METAQDYLYTKVLTASPHQLHLLVVDGALRFARQGLMALEGGDWEMFELTLSRSRDCVTELIGGLNTDGPGDVVDSLKALFAFVFRKLALADPERDPQAIQDAIRILEIHRQTWVELGEKLGSRGTTDAVPTPHARSWTT